VSSAYFNDSLNRPTQVIAAANNATLKTQNTFAYDDVNRAVTTTSDLTQYLDNQKKTETWFDGLGRQVEARTYETSSKYIVTKNTYSGLSSQVSNPYRPWQGETPQWTTTVVDALGRVKSVTTPDNAAVTTSYNGSETIITDPTGKKRKSVSDSLGRVAYVYEDPLGANYQTIYGYNAVGNLVSVAQDYLSQPPRQFVYDSLSRIVSATNPESGTTTFKYDEAGNLLVRTDARGVSAHYSFDQLNRPIRRWYNGSSASTATTHNDPAIPSGVGSTNEINYFYDQQALPSGAPTFTRGPSNGALVAITFAGSSEGNYFGRDAIGRQLVKIQRTGSVNYQLTLGYNNVGAITSLTYPSLHSVNYGYDGAGRLNSLGGNLGDETTWNYSTAVLYSPWGGITKEQFGTQTAVYNKSHYNVRGQLYDVRASSVDAEWSGELGALVNYYSTNWQHGGSGTDNNGNVLMSQTIINSYYMEDRYSYDALNRLTVVNEYQNGATQTGSQQYNYDRWGNRTISQASWGTGINTKQFTVDPYYNRLSVPGGQTGVMTYDAAGNLTNDTYTGSGNRTYDAENRITSAWGGNNQAQLYVYDPAGERIKRTVNSVETWQIYGFGGELLAEYPINGAASNPQTEYAYRNGHLLVIASSSQRQWLLADHLGTPRMIIDQTGTLSNLKRRDYLPFGEELPAGVGGRTSALGYNTDATRQGFTGYQADAETGLNYAQARYQSSVQGRFISPDPISGNIVDPQSWNMYSYVGNSPTNRTDPSGMSYFMGSGANDPFIRENQYRVDGFDMSPQGTASNLTDEIHVVICTEYVSPQRGDEFHWQY